MVTVPQNKVIGKKKRLSLKVLKKKRQIKYVKEERALEGKSFKKNQKTLISKSPLISLILKTYFTPYSTDPEAGSPPEDRP